MHVHLLLFCIIIVFHKQTFLIVGHVWLPSLNITVYGLNFLNPEPEPSRALQTIPLQRVGRVQAQTASRVWMSDRMLLHEKQSNTAIPQASQALDTTLDHFWRSVCCWVNPLILGLEIWHVINHDVSVKTAFGTHYNHHTLRPW